MSGFYSILLDFKLICCKSKFVVILLTYIEIKIMFVETLCYDNQ